MSIKTNKNFSLKKFSNIALFERREKNNMKIKSSKKIIPLKLYKNKNKVNEENKINSDFSHILFSFYSYQTEGNSTYKSFSKKSTNITTKSIFNKTTNNFNDTSFPFYLTETEPNIVKKLNNNRNLKIRHKKGRTDALPVFCETSQSSVLAVFDEGASTQVLQAPKTHPSPSGRAPQTHPSPSGRAPKTHPSPSGRGQVRAFT